LNSDKSTDFPDKLWSWVEGAWVKPTLDAGCHWALTLVVTQARKTKAIARAISRAGLVNLMKGDLLSD
jgi:hypothetical protein